MSASHSEPLYANDPLAGKRENLPVYYNHDISKYLTSGPSEILIKYGNIPQDRLKAHVHAIRDKAWEARQYPCTGLGVFLVPWISKSPAYPKIVQILKSGKTFLDIGCFIGYDMRQLVFDGAPSENMFGIDIVPRLWDIGFELFNDKDKFKATFVDGNILKADENQALSKLKGNVDVIEFAAVLHQWDRETQLAALKQAVSFSKIGTLLVGYQIGNGQGGEGISSLGAGKPEKFKMNTFKHGPETFTELWSDVSKETATKWDVSAQIRSFNEIGWDEKDRQWLKAGDAVLDFVVRRTA